MQLGDVELLAGGGTLQSLHDVVIALEDPPLHAASGQASLDREKGVLYLSDGLLIHDSEQALSLHFEQLELQLDGRQEAVGPGAPKDLLESRKRWTWPLMAGLLCLVVVPASLRGRAGLALGFWLSVWGVVRFCDHYMGALGLSMALLIPPLVLLSALLVEWLRWEEA